MDSGGFCCHKERGRVWNGKSYPEAEVFDALFAQARVHCDNKPQQIGPNHDYNMTISISPR